MPQMNFHQSHAIAQADLYATNAGLPSYSDLLRFADRMAHLDAGCLLTRDDFANIARSIVAPEGRRLPLEVVYGGYDVQSDGRVLVLQPANRRTARGQQ